MGKILSAWDCDVLAPIEKATQRDQDRLVCRRSVPGEDRSPGSFAGGGQSAQAGKNTGNARNGKNRKSARSIYGDIDLDVPRERNGTFEPQLVKKDEKQLQGFDKRMVSLYAHGMAAREIQAHVQEIYSASLPGD